QNANTHNITANLGMQRFYDFLGLRRRDGKVLANASPLRRDKAGNPPNGQEGTSPKASGKGWNTLVDVLTMVKRINLNYSENNGTVLPGYTQSVGFIGTARPSLGFVFGSQSDLRYEAARKGWLTSYPQYNAQYIRNTNKNLNITATAQPTQDLTIDLSADRQYTMGSQENYSPDRWANFQDGLVNEMGNFTISTLMIGTIFNKSDEFDSETFEQFKQNRLIIADRLVSDRGQAPGTLDGDGFPERYGKTQQE